MAIRASFEFEKNFYEKCKVSPLSADQIEKLSIVAQEKHMEIHYQNISRLFG